MFPNLNCICTHLEAASKVSQSQAESDVPISKPFPVMGGHPVPESGKTQHEGFGLYHCTAGVFALMCTCCSILCVMFCCTHFLYTSSGRCNPPSGSRPHHHRSAAAHDQLSSQTCPSQAEESPAPHHGGVRLPDQRHVPVANQARGSKYKSAEV